MHHVNTVKEAKFFLEEVNAFRWQRLRIIKSQYHELCLGHSMPLKTKRAESSLPTCRQHATGATRKELLKSPTMSRNVDLFKLTDDASCKPE